jgi:hypothetical protein
MFGVDRERKKPKEKIMSQKIHRRLDFTCSFNNYVKIDHEN